MLGLNAKDWNIGLRNIWVRNARMDNVRERNTRKTLIPANYKGCIFEV